MQAIDSVTNAGLSHTTAWNVIQKVGNRLRDREEHLVNKYERGELKGDREIDVLFQEADGVWLSIQGKAKPARGRKKEMKVAVNYEGFKKLEKLYNYLASNRRGLVSYLLRGLKLPELPEGLTYRGMGTMEGNVCDVITLRMKNRKMSWSEKGASNLATLLTARASDSLYEQLDKIFDDTVSKEMLEEMVEMVQLTAA